MRSRTMRRSRVPSWTHSKDSRARPGAGTSFCGAHADGGVERLLARDEQHGGPSEASLNKLPRLVSGLPSVGGPQLGRRVVHGQDGVAPPSDDPRPVAVDGTDKVDLGLALALRAVARGRDGLQVGLGLHANTGNRSVSGLQSSHTERARGALTGGFSWTPLTDAGGSPIRCNGSPTASLTSSISASNKRPSSCPP